SANLSALGPRTGFLIPSPRAGSSTAEQGPLKPLVESSNLSRLTTQIRTTALGRPSGAVPFGSHASYGAVASAPGQRRSVAVRAPGVQQRGEPEDEQRREEREPDQP